MNFIEVTDKENMVHLVNADHIEEIICQEDGGCTIYFAFTAPNRIDQDYIEPLETYAEIKNMIWR